MKNLNGNRLCVVDIETTGADPERHEIIQIALVPLDENLSAYHPLVLTIKPDPNWPADPEAMAVHNIDPATCQHESCDAVEIIQDWWTDLDLPLNRRLTPIAHNYIFEHGFLVNFFGQELYSQMFHYLPRCTMQFALLHNDVAAYHNMEAPFERVSLTYLCNHFGIVNDKPHDAYYDCIAEAQLYRSLLGGELYRCKM